MSSPRAKCFQPIGNKSYDSRVFIKVVVGAGVCLLKECCLSTYSLPAFLGPTVDIILVHFKIFGDSSSGLQIRLLFPLSLSGLYERADREDLRVYTPDLQLLISTLPAHRELA